METEQAGAERNREIDRSFFSNYKFEACLCDNQVNKQEQMFIHAVNDVFVLSLLTSQPLTKGVASVAKRLQPWYIITAWAASRFQ